MTTTEKLEALAAIRDSYEQGYGYAVEKACEWLEENMQDYANCVYEGEELTDKARVSSNLIKDLRKAMEEQQ